MAGLAGQGALAGQAALSVGLSLGDFRPTDSELPGDIL